MKPAPTLIDEVYRSSFRTETNRGWRSNVAMRRALEGARRFIVDQPMAVFMAELANESFIRAGLGNPLRLKIADSLRVSARLPHESIWIEYDLRAYQDRANALLRQKPPNPADMPEREGWLIQQHPKIDSAMIMHLFNSADTPDQYGDTMWTFPLAYGWCADDSPLPWRSTVSTVYGHPSSRIVGLGGYDRDNVNCVQSPLIENPDKRVADAYGELFREWTGILRRVWALLATIDNLPLAYGQVRQSKGFLGRGSIRKFLDHTTIRLNIPAKKDSRVLARQMIAIAHRKRHEVRAFWRDDWRHPPKATCNPHLWEFRFDDDTNHIECSVCHGRQTLVPKHERGDASLGYVTHDYSLTHKENVP